MTDGNRSYWDKHAKNYDRSMSLLGRPIPRMVELAGEATRGRVMGREREAKGAMALRSYEAATVHGAAPPPRRAEPPTAAVAVAAVKGAMT